MLFSLPKGIVSTADINVSSLWFSVKLSLVTATISAVLAIIVALPAAYTMSRYNFPFKDLVSALLYLPFVVSPITIGAMLLIFFNTPAGSLIERYFIRVVFEVPGLVGAQFVVVVGVAVILSKAAFDFIDPHYENLARTLGADRIQVFFRIVLPLAKNGVLSVFLLV